MWKGNLKHPGLATQSGTPPECSPGWLDGTLWPKFGLHILDATVQTGLGMIQHQSAHGFP